MKIPDKISLSIRGTDQDTDPVELLYRVKSAIRSPEEVIKSERRKSTLKVNIAPWGDIFLKVYERDLKRTVLSPFRLSKMKKTWKLTENLLNKEIPVPEPAFFLEIKKSVFTVQTYVAYLWIDGGVNFGMLALDKDIFHNDDFKSILCCGLDIVIKLHNAGFVHGDLKWSNLLHIDGGDPKVMLIDTDSLKKSSSPNLQGKDLARFILSAMEYQLKPDLREELVDRYIKGRKPRNTLIEKTIRKRIAKKKKKYEGRAVRSNSIMDDCIKTEKKLSRGYLKIFYRRGDEKWGNLALSYWEGKIERLTRVKSSPHTIIHAGTVMDQSFYFKRYLMRDTGDRIKHIIRPSRARRAFVNGEMIEALGFHPPRSVCFIEEWRAGFIQESALITEAIKDAPEVRCYIDTVTTGSVQLRRQFLQSLGRAVGAMHSRGVHHGDMRVGNILCRFLHDEFVFYWLDNERTKRYATLPMSRRINNLVQLNMERGLTLTDRMRFWKAYMEESRIPSIQEKEITHKVMKKTMERLQGKT